MIKVKGLRKHFGPKIAVDGVTFQVQKGEVLGFLGPNGAGKSTTMRMVTGFLPPTDGFVSIGGSDIVDDEITAKSKIGYLPEAAPLYSDMTVEDFLRFCAEMRRSSRRIFRKRSIKRSILVFSTKFGTRVSILFRKDFGIEPVLLNRSFTIPRFLYLMSRPTDWIRIKNTKCGGLIKRMGEKKAIVFSTHILEEVEAVCSRAIIIDRGKNHRRRDSG